MDIKISNTDKFAIEGISENTILSELFFSEKNINYIQMKIINIIKKKYGYKISKQSKNELIIIMRSVYINNSKNSYKNKEMLKKELTTLNKLVLTYCTKNIINNIISHNLYLQKINNDLMPIDKPVNTNIKGDKQLELTKFI